MKDAELLEGALEAALRAVPEQSIREMLSYAVFPAGKRVRPNLILQLVTALGGIVSDDVFRACAAVELIHCASLVHDDLPAVDDDDLRRGLPSFHVKFGEGNAVLSGDLMYAIAFKEVSQITDAERRTDVLCILSDANLQVQRGQLLDIQNAREKEQILRIHRLKTASLFEACTLIAYSFRDVRSAVSLKDIKQYGATLGALFQALNDVEDEHQQEQDARVAGSDLQTGRGSIGLLGEAGDSYLLQAKEQFAESHSQLLSKATATAGLSELLGCYLK